MMHFFNFFRWRKNLPPKPEDPPKSPVKPLVDRRIIQRQTSADPTAGTLMLDYGEPIRSFNEGLVHHAASRPQTAGPLVEFTDADSDIPHPAPNDLPDGICYMQDARNSRYRVTYGSGKNRVTKNCATLHDAITTREAFEIAAKKWRAG